MFLWDHICNKMCHQLAAGCSSSTFFRPYFFSYLFIYFLFYVLLCCSMYCLFCDVLCIVFVYMCTEKLPPGGYPIAVKYTISYHIISYILLHYGRGERSHCPQFPNLYTELREEESTYTEFMSNAG